MRADHVLASAPADAPDGPARAATLKVRARYAKTGKLRFVSAIDLGRLWERALRQADLPIAYSEGFSPHPKVSFPDALPLGYASTGEYVELTFAAPISIPADIAGLNRAFPTGLEVLVAKPIPTGAPRLSKWLRASCWDMDYPGEVDLARLESAVQAVRAAESVMVDRERKGDAVSVDLRPAIHDIAVFLPAHGSPARVRAVLHHVEPPVRPSEVHLALVSHDPERLSGAALPEPALITRVAQGQPTGDGLVEALTGDAVPVGPARHTSLRGPTT